MYGKFGQFWFDDYIKAGHPTTCRDLLELLSGHESARVRRRVAENGNTPTDILSRLAEDIDPEVRLAAATNNRTPIDVVFALALDEDLTVRHGLAEDTTTPIGVLKRLVRDDNPYVATRARKTLIQLQEMNTAAQKANVVTFPNLSAGSGSGLAIS